MKDLNGENKVGRKTLGISSSLQKERREEEGEEEEEEEESNMQVRLWGMVLLNSWISQSQSWGPDTLQLLHRARGTVNDTTLHTYFRITSGKI